MRTIIALLCGAALTAAAEPKKFVTPADVVAAAPASAWQTIPADDLLLIDLKGGGRIVVQLAPQFAPVHVANIRALAGGGWWDGAAVYRVQDNYVAQWGNNEGEKPLPKGVVAKPPAEYTRPLSGLSVRPLGFADPYAPAAGFALGWPVAYSAKDRWANLAHCYASVGVGRDLSPDTGTGGELYAVIGHGPRHLDRNIALVGRVIEGIERLSSLPRGTEALGFYKERSQDVPIASARLASQLPAGDRPTFEYLETSSASFNEYLRVRANRRDDFYIRPAGGVDVCNVSVPVRRRGR
jgi:peptidylprolyl isomerase